MTWAEILKLIEQYFSKINDASAWKMSIDDKAVGKITAVKFNTTDAQFKFNDGAKDHTLDAKPGTVSHASVYFDNKLDDASRLVVRVTGQLGKPIIIILTFKNVTNGGKLVKYRFDYPK